MYSNKSAARTVGAHTIAAEHAATEHGTSAAPAMWLVNASRQLVLATPAARDHSAQHQVFDVVNGVLVARDELGAARLHAASIAILSGTDLVRTLYLSDDVDRIEVQLVALYGEGRPPHIMISLRDPPGVSASQLDRATRRFGLTPAEARLLAVLCDGLSLSHASRRLGVARTTVRTHLQRIFDKSGTHRQAELVGLVLSD